MDTFGLGSPNCYVVNVSSLVRRLKRSFCQRANRVIALDRAAILTEYASVEDVGRSYTHILPITYDESREGRPLPEAIENALRALFCEKKNVFNMRVNERGLGRFPKKINPKRGGAI